MHAFEIRLGSSAPRTCCVRVGRGALGRLVADLRANPPGRRLFLVSDSHVAPLHADPLRRRLRRAGLAAELLTFRAGERSKSRRTKERLENELAARGAARDDAIVAVGGGVTGDLAGFLAATWHRGVPVVQVPTSLLAMLDAAIGGKTAVNVPAGKNLVGAFHQPWGVYADPDVLDTLPRRRFVEGFAEAVKSAVIADARLFTRLERDAAALLARDTTLLERLVADCVRIKARFVERDERESGRRAALNFGHTVGHALESVSSYKMGHGQAVAVGMVCESRLATGLTGFPERDVERLRHLLEALGLPDRLPRALDPDAVFRAMRQDKKVRRGQVRLALPRGIGRMAPGPDPTIAVPPQALRRAVRA